MTKKRTTREKIWLAVAVVGTIVTWTVTGSIVFKSFHLEKSPLSLAMIPLLLGLGVEHLRLGTKFKNLFYIVTASLLLSFMAFMPNTEAVSDPFYNNALFWPFLFLFFFLIISMIFHDQKLVPKITEGITLIQSVAIIYWIGEFIQFPLEKNLLYIPILLALLFVLYSFIHAFSYIKLSRTSRLVLSIWSSLIMVILAADNVYQIFHQDLDLSADISVILYVCLSYFLLGVSLMYMLRNAYLLMDFLPQRGANRKQRKKDRKELKDLHVKRFSREQVNVVHSLIVLVLIASWFLLNHHYQLLPRNLAIWIAFLLFPFLNMVYALTIGKLIRKRE